VYGFFAFSAIQYPAKSNEIVYISGF